MVIWRRGTIFRKLTALYPTHACEEHNRVFPLLMGVLAGAAPRCDARRELWLCG